VAEEVRNAIDAYLAGITAEELDLLDAVTLEAKRHLDAMADDLARINGKLDAKLAELAQLKSSNRSLSFRTSAGKAF
jgi:hypothetical protein